MISKALNLVVARRALDAILKFDKDDHVCLAVDILDFPHISGFDHW
jgi:hypothetical protein